ncbi:ABC transporter permease [Kineococcus sp. TBRC 1896]|uniref:ABC transporter permease n=1 Tax=Kineococcus mangrovi TaxID=1660183 RepID=A0ABV4I085_9ACTN
MSRARRTATALLVVGTVVLVAGALTGPWWSPGSPTAPRGLPYLPPGDTSGEGLALGTDGIGRDVWARVLHGGRDVVLVALGATAVSGLLAPVLGTAAAMAGRRSGELLVRVLDVVTVVPALLVLLVLATGWPGSPWALVVGIAVVSVPYSTRIVRAAVTSVLRTGFVEVARARGDSARAVFRYDLLPSVARPLLTDTAIRFVAALHLSATAGFLGLGRGAPAPNWGRMVSDDLPGIELNPFAVLVPAALLVASSLLVGTLADTVADRVGRG